MAISPQIINAFFLLKNGTPATGLTPSIIIWNVTTTAGSPQGDVIVIGGGSPEIFLTEVGSGFYKYIFSTYDNELKYAFRIDGEAGGGPNLGGGRYSVGTNASFADDIAYHTWEESTAAHDTGSPQPFGSAVRDIHGQIRREIYIDTGAGSNGDGYQQSPYDNVTDAIDDAEDNGITRLVFLDDATLDRQLRNFCITGSGHPTIDLNGQNVNGSEFNVVDLDGSYIGSITANKCTLRNNISGVNGIFFNCGLGGLISLAPGAFFRFVDGYSEIAGLATPEISLSPAGSPVTHQVDIRNYSGGLTISNSIGSGNAMTISMSQGRVFLAASNTAGTISVRGVAFLQDLSAGATIDTSALLQPANVVDTLTLVGTLLKFQANRTVLDRAAFTLTIYDNDNVTPIRVFDLREFGVGPSITTITERLPASGSPLTP